MEKLCGIDEAGRGPIAGPLVMAGVILNQPVSGLNDSKKLSEKRRESLYEEIIATATYHIVRFDASQIDDLGISACLKAGLEEIMQMMPTENFLFDGSSTFGATGLQTLVKADATVAEVSAASILAKVTRDREMVALSKHYPEYEFAAHKGYGTDLHVKKIREHGYSPIHRRSFRLKALEPTLFDL